MLVSDLLAFDLVPSEVAALRQAMPERLLPLQELAVRRGLFGAADLLNRLTSFVGSGEPGGIIVIETEKRNFSFSELSRLVETNDAVITQLNTDEQPESGMVTITIKINKTEIADVVATLQRFEYNVVYYSGEEAYENELRSNYNNLMNYLNI